MKKICLISDIHSNFYYLTKILEEIKKKDIDAIYCLGDLVGYYDQPNEVIELLLENNVTCIKGNHENYLLGSLDYKIEKENLYNIQKQKKIITKYNLRIIEDLPDNIEFVASGKKFYLTHSLPNDCTTYLYDLKKLDKKFISKFDYYCFGHTHIPLITYKYNTCIINPGSVGQPRDYGKRPSYIIIDLKNDFIFLNKVSVSNEKYSKILANKNFSYKLIDILNRG